MAAAHFDANPAIASLLDVVCRMTGMGVALVARVTDASWTVCAVRDEIAAGIRPGDTLPTDMTLCVEVKDRGRLLAVSDVAADPVHGCNPLMSQGRFRSYISAPVILADGSFFGTLCAFAHEPVQLDTPRTASVFNLFASLVADQVNTADLTAASAADLRNAATRLDISETGRQNAEAQLAISAADLEASNATLLDAQATAVLREQFVAVLGHDLRNPLSAIMSGAILLRREPLGDRGRQVLGMMEQSAARMGELVRNMLDFALTQLGGGIPVGRQVTANLGAVLRHVADELQARYPDRAIAERFDLDAPVECDPDRIGQLLSNLLANALTHGAAEMPVRVEAAVADGAFVLAVANAGKPIPPDAMDNLFKPFVRGNRESREGLGLGLHIAAAIAQAHGGTLTVTSTAEETRFTLRMPSGPRG